MQSNNPLVTVGIPVFNGEKTLIRSLESITNQTYKDIEIIISNNCSIDNTEKICNSFKEKNKNIKYYRQEIKLSMYSNFRFVLSKSSNNTKYFTWVASDDYRSKNFIENNVNFLEDNNDYIASISPAKYDTKQSTSYKIGDLSLDQGNVYLRLKMALSMIHSNSRIFSLFTKKAFDGFEYLDDDFLGYDFLFILHLLRKGKFKRINNGSVILSKSGTSNKKNIFKIYRDSAFEIVFPFNKLLINALNLYRKDGIFLKLQLIYRINKLNYFSIILRIKWLILKIIKK